MLELKLGDAARATNRNANVIVLGKSEFDKDAHYCLLQGGYIITIHDCNLIPLVMREEAEVINIYGSGTMSAGSFRGECSKCNSDVHAMSSYCWNCGSKFEVPKK